MTLMITLLIAGIILVIAEIFIPGGICGAMGAVCLLAGVVLAFVKLGVEGGIGVFAGVIVFGGAAAWAWVKFFPRTGIGKHMFLGKSGEGWHSYSAKNAGYLGQTGVTKTMLRPGGTAIIAGDRVDVVTEGQLLEAGTPIKVIEVQGNRIVVAADERPGQETDDNPAAG